MQDIFRKGKTFNLSEIIDRILTGRVISKQSTQESSHFSLLTKDKA